MFPRTPRNTGVYTRHPTFVTATSGVLTRLPAKLSKNRMRVYTLSDMRSKTKLRVYTASEAKGLKERKSADPLKSCKPVVKNISHTGQVTQDALLLFESLCQSVEYNIIYGPNPFFFEYNVRD